MKREGVALYGLENCETRPRLGNVKPNRDMSISEKQKQTTIGSEANEVRQETATMSSIRDEAKRK